jgi:type 1 fimbriae regulatory protein FimB/type 1 fimbriae regulatory protein FimE
LDRPFSSKFIDELFALYVLYKQFPIQGEESPEMKANLKLVTPTIEKQTVRQRASKNPEGRKPNAELRTREHLTPAEVETLIKTMKGNRNGHRDATMILIAYRHGLRVSELCDLQWNQIDFQSAAIHIRRVKRGTPATHPLTGNELRDLRKLKRENDSSPFVFVSELGTPFTAMGFSQMLKRAADKAGLGIKVHAHMLRHACGFKLANDGVDTRSSDVPLDVEKREAGVAD